MNNIAHTEETFLKTTALIDQLIFRVSEYSELNAPVDWGSYNSCAAAIHKSYTVPATSCTPVMSQLLYSLGYSKNPGCVVGAGTFVGYCVSWILGLCDQHRRLQRALLIDTDERATNLSKQNCAALGYGAKLEFLCQAAEDLTPGAVKGVDILFIDIDSPLSGKSGYIDVLKRYLPELNKNALLLAHDPCIPKFRKDLTRFHHFIQESDCFDGPWIFPVDDCGLSVAVRR